MRKIILAVAVIAMTLIFVLSTGSDPALKTLQDDPMANLQIEGLRLEHKSDKKQSKNWKGVWPAEVNRYYSAWPLEKILEAEKTVIRMALEDGWTRQEYDIFTKETATGKITMDILIMEEGGGYSSNNPTLVVRLMHQVIK